MKKRKSTAVAPPLFTLVSGPRNTPLMLEQSGIRYATLFSSQEHVARFQQACCSAEIYQVQFLETAAEVASNLQHARKLGCSLLLIDPSGPAVEPHQSKLIGGVLRELVVNVAAI